MNKTKSKFFSIVVAVSGAGRTLDNLLRYAETQSCSFRIVGVISSKKACGGEVIAEAHHLPLLTLDYKQTTEPERTKLIENFLKSTHADLVALGGYLKPFPVPIGWANRIVNIHPALLPAHGGKGMYGKHVHEAVVAAKETKSGATIHVVSERYDEGQMIAQVEINVPLNETAEDLASRVFAAECWLYPEILQMLASGTLVIGSHMKPLYFKR